MTPHTYCPNCKAILSYVLEDGRSMLHQKEHPIEHCIIYLRGEVQLYKDVHNQSQQMHHQALEDYAALRYKTQDAVSKETFFAERKYWQERSRTDTKHREEVLEAMHLTIDLNHEEILKAIKPHKEISPEFMVARLHDLLRLINADHVETAREFIKNLVVTIEEIKG